PFTLAQSRFSAGIHPLEYTKSPFLVSKEHETFARDQHSENICSMPLRKDDQPVAVLTCERRTTPFSEVEVRQFRLACDQAIPRLADLQRNDRWFGARWKTWAREALAKFLGPEHTWSKLFAILGCAAVVFCSVPIFTYKVEGNFILRSDEVSFLTAPFEGYIQDVGVRPGDIVNQGAELVGLNTDDLLLQEAGAVADQARYFREMEKARAAGELAEMRISQALADQAEARLQLIRYRLEQASIKAPFAGVIVEGDLRQRIGAPVKQGDALLKVARTDSLYVEAEVNERDVQEILKKANAEIAFVTQPKLKFPVEITRVEQAAFPKDQQNVFLVRCALTGAPEGWWRPGMSGVCKIPVEKRTLAWIFTHRTVDFLRMFFWW
ncbi:MAG: HlyD family efflux transporter periplasmic adaptor subunit, partial [Verrucomicrobia bacterium]|nr:HlyD family efflux transporter periplasmic adaptor subunit [Verrucomicrobiota bacterium]